MSHSKKLLLISSFCVLFILASGCGGGNMPMGSPPANTASLRVVQGNAAAGTMSLLVDGMTAGSSVTFPGSSGYMPVKVGAQVTLQPANIGPSSALTQTLNVPVNSRNTFILDGWGPFGFSTMMLADDMSPSPNGDPKLRVMDGATSSVPLDVYAMPAGTILPSGTPALSSISFNSASSYLALPAGSYDLFFTVAISVGGSAGQVLFHTGTISLAANQNRTVILINDCTQTTCSANIFRSMLLADLN